MNTSEKKQVLKEKIAARGSMLVSFSGGVDSSLLAVLAKETLGNKTRCALLDSPVVPRKAVAEARQIAEDFGLELDIIPLHIMSDERFTNNPAERCYWCKKNSSTVLKWRAVELGLACIADGINVSDTGEHRPGLKASTEEGVVHPYLEAEITKADIREIAREHGFHFWDKPSAACLSSRIPYGEVITHEKLTMVEEAEAYLHASGFLHSRVRMHGTIARIEVPKRDLEDLMAMKDDVVKTFRTIGFFYVTLDLEGYRSGSLDEVLQPYANNRGTA
ncbi:MAG TPA: ATP-dependent sacrificial sulfur transferase LarE [Methanoregula sp.]|nr:ATP-dependent sacrificial sulfur transferase LarE [Methanoregula sp.]